MNSYYSPTSPWDFHFLDFHFSEVLIRILLVLGSLLQILILAVAYTHNPGKWRVLSRTAQSRLRHIMTCCAARPALVGSPGCIVQPLYTGSKMSVPGLAGLELEGPPAQRLISFPYCEGPKWRQLLGLRKD